MSEQNLTDGVIRVADLPEADRAFIRDELRRNTPLHHLLALEVVEIGTRHAVVSMPVREEAFNSTGNLHGGALATLIDVAAGTAAARGSGFRPGEQSLVTADLHVRYLGRPNGDTVYAHAEVIKAGRQLVIVECRVKDPEGRIVAAADFSMMIVPLRQALRPVPDVRPHDPDL
ncbi:PaaI family thioesterase [Actinocorallia sp. API 0066]|uniref:PaaI family thioesterase n=1 Tax=Actinocorallia sp. API 0066 TaxID=2896846 RepID=UPI001E308A12|nr:PaaI family thioesterase [Actinocorallia sp. API 0066]MCD0450196.1 PaaI family thioesterase [Actinocorallia sp. API 0066]